MIDWLNFSCVKKKVMSIIFVVSKSYGQSSFNLIFPLQMVWLLCFLLSSIFLLNFVRLDSGLCRIISTRSASEPDLRPPTVEFRTRRACHEVSNNSLATCLLTPIVMITTGAAITRQGPSTSAWSVFWKRPYGKDSSLIAEFLKKFYCYWR